MEQEGKILTQHLIMNNKVFSFLEIKSKLIVSEDEYMNEVLRFCHDWLTGQQGFVLNTSGSTGIPKPISIKRKQMEASAFMTADALDLELGMKAFCCLNTNYIAGKMMLVRAMMVGMSIEVVKPSSIPFSQDTKAFDFIALVPMQIDSIINSRYLTLLNQAKKIIVGGAPISFFLTQQIKQKILPEVYHTYGMTETVSHIALKKVKDDDVYQVLDGVKVSLSDKDCLEIEADVTNGEKLVTNDIVELLGGNQFRWLGRSDFVVNSGGVKIHPALLEDEIQQILYEKNIELNHFFIIGIPDERLGEKIVMCVEGEDVDLSAVFDCLEAYQQPKKVFFIEKFEYTKTGKVNKKETLTKCLSQVVK